jgi:hypothetical protein
VPVFSMVDALGGGLVGDEDLVIRLLAEADHNRGLDLQLAIGPCPGR